ncbi:MAG TPA: DegT/DnrJ/EryC1/StrS family aminotransferase [Azospirillaceae bacterium]|nr:DegT/DnrJ/EryC1/StrS family aminotransferase [Azospirillaceae bacterium]
MAIPFLDLRAMHDEIRDELNDAWDRVVRTGAFIGGEFVERFEAEWSAYCGTAHCVGLSDGTAALELSLRALGIGAGDEVIVPGNTFIATAEAVAKTGARPVFIDVDPSTHLITADGVRSAVTPRTAAVIVVHLYGQPADMDAIARTARAAGIAVVEDAAQAHGAQWNGRRAGALSDAACFSFYPGKNLGAFGDAGAVVTNDPSLAERVRMMGNHGRPPGRPEIHNLVGGTNRLDGLQAAVLSIKLKRLDGWNARRARAAARYAQALAGLPVRLVTTAPGAVSSHHLAVIEADHRDELRRRLADEGISTGIHYPVPCHHQVAFRTTDGSGRVPSLPVVENLARRILSLPMFPHLTARQIRQVANAIARALDDTQTTAAGTRRAARIDVNPEPSAATHGREAR